MRAGVWSTLAVSVGVCSSPHAARGGSNGAMGVAAANGASALQPTMPSMAPRFDRLNLSRFAEP